MRKITEEGVTFASPVNGDKLFMSPEVSMQIQTILNSDIVMQLDECTPYETKGHLTTEAEARKAKDGLARKMYESGGSDAVKKSEKLREQAVKDLIRIKNNK
jgi:tRNA-guanine family transglycosylase